LAMMQQGIERVNHEDLPPMIAGYLQADGENDIDVAKFIDDVVNVTEMLIDQGEEYDFAHLTFQEYLAAAEIVRLKQESLLHDKLSDDRWKMVILYYAGLVRNASDLVQRLLTAGNPLATECLREAKRVEPEVKAAIATLSQQVKDSRYTRLEALLKAGEWEAADRETDKVMLQVAGQDERGFLMPDDLQEFPCEDLLVIDQLWFKASGGHFGFSVQKKIWQECGSPMSTGKDWDRFCAKVGWKVRDKYVNYSSLHKNTSLSPVGELPGIESRFLVICSSLFSRSDL
jgi:GUN4-like